MKGSPLRDAVILLIISLGLLVPLAQLARKPGVVLDTERTELSDSQEAEAWIEARFSHPPLSAEIWQKTDLLWQGGGEEREDGDILLQNIRGESELRFSVTWEDSRGNAYAELQVELPGQHPQRLSGWSRTGQFEQVKRIEWMDSP